MAQVDSRKNLVFTYGDCFLPFLLTCKAAWGLRDAVLLPFSISPLGKANGGKANRGRDKSQCETSHLMRSAPMVCEDVHVLPLNDEERNGGESDEGGWGGGNQVPRTNRQGETESEKWSLSSVANNQ